MGNWTNNNKMSTMNKIKQAEQSLTNSSLQFHSFIGSLREQRHEQTFPPPSHSEDSINPLHLQTNHKSNRSQIIPHQGHDLQVQKSMSNFSSQVPLIRKKDDDAAIKNKFRMSVGNRHRFDRYQLPPYCFSHVKEGLSQHLKQFKRQPQKQIQTPNPTPKRPLQRQNQFSQLQQARGLKGVEKPRRIKELNSTIILKFCILNKLDFQTTPKEILRFFSKIIDLCNYQMGQPTIQKYKNCVYFGEPIKKNQHYQGIVYYFSGEIYYGELYNNHKNGYGVQVLFQEQATYKGQFRDDQKIGIFQVQKHGQRYYGELKNNLYHGRGRLIQANQTYQGQFFEGQKVQSPNKKLNGRQSARKDDSFYTRKQYYTPQKPLAFSRTAYNDLSPSKMYRNSREQFSHNQRPSNPWKFSQQPRKTRQKKLAWPNSYENTRQFNFALEDPEQSLFRPEPQHQRRTTKAASLRIREIGKLRNRPIIQQQEQQPLPNRL